MLGHNFPPVLLLSSLPFFFFLFLFRFVVDSKPSAGDHKKKPERARELGTSAASFVISRCIEGDMRGGGNIWFSLSWNSPWHHATGEKKKKRRIICRPAWRYECHGFHTHVHQTLSHTRTHTKVNECERICMCYSCVQRCKEMRSESKIFFVCFLDLNWERERERENLNLISFFGNCSLSDFGSFVCDWHWAGAKLAGFR